MKGIRYITDQNNQRTAVVIDIQVLEKNRGRIEDFLDILVAEARKNEPKMAWEEAKQHLIKSGKI